VLALNAEETNIYRGGKKLKTRSSFSPIGLDIGSSLIKIIQLQKKGSRLAIYRQAVNAVPAATFVDGVLREPEMLGSRLADLGRKLNLQGKSVNLCLGPQASYLRLIKLPPLSKKELRLAIPWEVEKHFPLSAVDAVYDCCPADCRQLKEKGPCTYILAAARKVNAEKLFSAAEQAGFKPETLEIVPVSLLRCYSAFSGLSITAAGKITLLLDIGHRCSTLMLVDNRGLQHHRLLQTGTADFIDAAAKTAGLDQQQACRFLFRQKPGSTGYPVDTAEKFAVQVARSIAFWSEQSGLKSSGPEEMFVSGGGALIPGLLPFLQKKLELEIKHPSFNHWIVEKPGFSGGLSSTALPLFSTAFGLSFRGWFR
jgi:type IV pilus assembly protein PilM